VTYAALATVSETLVELLRDRIDERGGVVSIDRSEIALVSPDDVGADSDVRLSVFLYDVRENSVMKNQSAPAVDHDRTRDTPLALDLRYLVTAFPSQSGSADTANTLDQQRVLGLAMQVLHDNAVLGADELPPSLAADTVEISLEEESMSAFTDIWSTFGDAPLQPSVVYQVSPVLVESTNEEAVSRGTETAMGYGQHGR
jgi:hypothetical protein